MSGPGAELTVVTYNVRAGIGPGDFPPAWWRRVDQRRLERIAQSIAGLQPDLVALQEVTLASVDGLVLDQPALFGQLTGLEYRYAAVHPFPLADPSTGELEGAGLWGNAVLSRLPIQRARAHALPIAGDDDFVEPANTELELAGVRYRDAPYGVRERRCVLLSEIELEGQTIHFLSTHLTHVGSGQRLAQSAELARLVSELEGPVLLAGDLNAPIEAADLAPLRALDDAFADVGLAPGDASRFSCGPQAIDHVLTRGFRTVGCRVAREAGDASDHWPVVAHLALNA